MTAESKLLVIGYGNPGRQDDGLGPGCAALLADFIKQEKPCWPIDIDINYQLTVEHALAVSKANAVIFIDAARQLSSAYQYSQLTSSEGNVWSYHIVTPGQCLWLAEMLYGKRPEAYLLAIQGVQFDNFEERLSDTALCNLNKAFQFLLIQLDRLLY